MKRKFSIRERWVLTFAPAVALGAFYLYGFAGDYAANLEKERKHLAEVSKPLPPPPTPPVLTKARAALIEVKHSVGERQATINQVQAHIATMPKSIAAMLDDRGRAQTIQSIESILARSGITPVVSELAGEGDAAEQALLSVLSPKLEQDGSGGKPLPKVWHYIFADTTPHFSRALDVVCRDAPSSVVPLTMNFVYNPDDDGQTRLLELWILY